MIMHMKHIRWLLLVVICFLPTLLPAEDPPKPSADPKGQVPAIQMRTERQTVASTEEVAVLRAQITEMRRSEDRLLSTVHWTLGAVVTVAIGLAAFSWWSSNKLHQQDLQRVKDDLLRQLSEVFDRTLAESAQKIEAAHGKEASRQHADLICFTLWKIGALRLRTGDIDGAIEAALEQASAAAPINSNYLLHATIALTEAFNRASDQRHLINSELIKQSRQWTIHAANMPGDHRSKLSDAIERYSNMVGT
jgi:hypothetical protein